MRYIVAATNQQARMVADRLGLIHNRWSVVHSPQQLHGVLPEQIVIAEPWLGRHEDWVEIKRIIEAIAHMQPTADITRVRT